MTPQFLVLVSIGVFALLGVGMVFLWPYFSRGAGGLRAKNIVSAQREGKAKDGDALSQLAEAANDGRSAHMTGAVPNLEKKLRYAQWTMTPTTYRIITICISAVCVIIAFLKLNILYQAAALIVGPATMSTILDGAIKKRFKRFDAHFASFLLSLVGLLKTGMNPLQALGSSAEGLEPDSLVRFEVEVMLERLRLGVNEEKSIGTFGEDILHPDIELFVQALLLSRRVGGTLSDTLARLSTQVRRRQYFRSMAVAAVSMQRGSVWFILSILVGLFIYIYLMLPKFVIESINNPIGWQIWQFGVLGMILGIYWVRKVSDIKV